MYCFIYFQIIGGAACQSASFHWPLIVGGDTIHGEFFFFNTTLRSHLEDRQPQRILIDIGQLEEHPIFQAKFDHFESLGVNLK
jgi:hypothetical protein